MKWLRLRQGRCSPSLSTGGRGVQGPIFGPFAQISLQLETEIQLGETWRLPVIDGWVFYGGMYYAKWSVVNGRPSTYERDYLAEFASDLAIPPDRTFMAEWNQDGPGDLMNRDNH